MKEIIQRATGPSIGIALGYFVVVLWLVPSELVQVEDKAEAVAMAGIIGVHFINELRGFFSWVGSFFKKDKEEE